VDRAEIALLFLLCTIAGSGCVGPAKRPIQLDPEARSRVLENRLDFRAGLTRSCPQLADVDQVIAQAILIGAPIYNVGSPLGCYRIYEGAAYKILYVVGDGCAELGAFVRGGLAQAEAEVAVDRKAWTMRHTFDAILGEPTEPVPLDESSY
jgi:hypothetical protein